MRLIDADALTRRVHEELHITNSRKDIIDLIDEAPTIDPSKSTDQNVADVPSGDLISRADAIEAVMAEGRNVHASEYANAERIIHEADAVEALAMLPSADRPKGEWIRKENNVSWWVECSKCGEKPLLDVYSHTYEKTPYCPSCGAYMRGE